MLRLRDIMTRELVTFAPELSLREAMDLLVTNHISGAPVVAQRRVLGVISATDLLGFAVTSPAAHDETRLDSGWEELESDVEHGEGDEPAAHWFVEMHVDEGSDVAERFNEDGARRAASHWFDEHTVSEVMNHSICALPSNTRVDQAAAFMRTAAIHRVLVVDDGALAGIVSMKDIVDAVADHKLTDRT